MRKLPKVMLTISGLLLAGFGTIGHATAQNYIDGYPVTLVVSAPAAETTIGRAVTFVGSGARPDSPIFVSIDGQSYVDPRDRTATEGRGASSPGVSTHDGHFSFSVDLNGASVIADSQGNKRALAAGRHQFVLFEGFGENPGKSSGLNLTIKADTVTALSQSANTAASTTPSTTPTPTVAATPTAPAGAVKTKGWTLDPVMTIISAAILASLLLLITQRLSPHRYR